MPATPTIWIRTDSSEQIGTGHVMRDLVLSQALRRHGCNVEFVCRPAHGDVIAAVESLGFKVHRLSPFASDGAADANDVTQILETQHVHLDWLIVDHYGLDAQWESHLRAHANRILVIDDLANRPHDCDVLLDQNLYFDMEHRYNSLVPAGCRRLLGPPYALLRQEFLDQQSVAQARNSVRHILISMGGSDAGNATGKALAAVAAAAGTGILTDVIVGSANPHLDQLRALSQALTHVNFHVAPKNMAALLLTADLAVGAGGISFWERCCLGLPSVAVAIADNQIEQLKAADGGGYVNYLGESAAVSADQIGMAVRMLIENPARLHQMSQACLHLMSAHKGEQALLEAILGTAS